MALLEAVDSKTEILAALTPLLITSLEQTSGDVILELAQLRSLCGTARYQRRFVQRVAPFWIRPPQAAMWCLRHQTDMEAVLAAAELILNHAKEIFRPGWYERGQLILADSKRAKTLDSAAQQLRTLSHADSRNLGFASGNKWLDSKKQHHQGVHMAEWEVGAVVRQMKVSIAAALKTDWSKVTAQEVPRPRRYHNRRVADSPKAPRSPTRPGRAPQSPPTIPAVTEMENVFGPAFDGRPASPPNTQSQATSEMSPFARS